MAQEAQLFIGCAVRVDVAERVEIDVPERVEIDVLERVDIDVPERVNIDVPEREGKDVEVFTDVVVGRAQAETTTKNKINKGSGMGAGERGE